MEKLFNLARYNGCDYLSMLGLILDHVSKRTTGVNWCRNKFWKSPLTITRGIFQKKTFRSQSLSYMFKILVSSPRPIGLITANEVHPWKMCMMYVRRITWRPRLEGRHFCKRHLQIDFREWKLLYFDSGLTKHVFARYKNISIGSDHGWVPNKWQTTTSGATTD